MVQNDKQQYMHNATIEAYKRFTIVNSCIPLIMLVWSPVLCQDCAKQRQRSDETWYQIEILPASLLPEIWNNVKDYC